jgi:molecular chaperone GrpE (heat shock protein)
MKIQTIIGLLLVAHGASASPRQAYLQDKINEAYRVELQAKSKASLEAQRYQASKAYTASLKRELANVRKRETRELEQARKAASAEYQQVGQISLEDMTAPTGIRVIR